MKLVAFLDILGFSEIVKHNSFEELEEIYKVFNRGYTSGVTRNKFIKKGSQFFKDFNDSNIQAIQISDSIILWTKEDTIKSYYDLILIVHELLGNGIFSGLPLRACIDYGEFGNNINFHSNNISTNTFYGKAIITSHQQCESQSWSGGFITKRGVEAYSKMCSSLNDNHLRSLTDIKSLEQDHFLKKFIVPFRNEKSEEYCINWVRWQDPKITLDNLIKSFGKHNKPTSCVRVKEIIQNTIEFWKSCPERLYPIRYR
jgi:hypothetical protein